MTEIEQIQFDLDQIKAELHEIGQKQTEILTILNALYVPVIKEQNRQMMTLPYEQRKAAARIMRQQNRAALKGAKA